MPKPRDLADTANQLTTGGPLTRARGTLPVATGPVRLMVELSPLESQALNRACIDLEERLGLGEVARAQVVRVLLELLSTDPDVAGEVRERLAEIGGTRRRAAGPT